MNGTIENSDNNFNQPTEANAGAAGTETSLGDKSDTDVDTNPGGFLTVKPAVESLPDIKDSVSEAEPTSVFEEKPKDESLIAEKPPLEPTPTGAETKENSPKSIENDIQIAGAILNKYPHSFSYDTTDAGELLLTFKGGILDDSGSFVHEHRDFDPTLVVCQAGFISIRYDLWKQIQHFGGLKTQFNLSVNEGFSRATVKLDNDQEQELPITDFRDKGIDLNKYKKWWSQYEEQHKNDKEPKPLTAQEIVDSL